MEQTIYDIAVLGCGPAGLSAAINASIRNKKVLIIGAELCSPPLHKAQKIENYLGLPGITGQDLLEKFIDHVEELGLERTTIKASSIVENQGLFNILLGEDMIGARSIVIATGIPYRATLPREEEFLGKGLGYCATCDGPLYRDKDVLLIGHGAEAEHEANFMAEICRKIYYLPLYQEVGRLDPRVQVVKERPMEIVGQDFVEGLKLKDESIIQVEGLFVLGGETAPDRLIPGLQIEEKHIKVNRQQETNIPGVFAAGDCTGAPYQVAKSVGEGQVAGLNAAKYVSRK
ncbi:MAG TPA: NAD(P)/FAD-dependent oxidoreductase [Syntrophomonadaceae bacterium]|nr:NAD(P)/FAD-dependent oxidoreductase [Syntrophomonadaceae bacterium]